MKRIVILLFISFSIYAGDLESYNLQITMEGEHLGKFETVIITPEEMELSILSDRKLTIKQQDLIGRTYLNFFNWIELNIKSAQLVFEGRRLSIILKINELVYKDVEISQYLPSGIQLYYDKFYEYDFRMFKDGLFMRLKGQYYSKEEFLEELYNAVADPILYIQIHDPSYIIRQIDELRTQNQNQDKELYEQLNNHSELLNRHNDLLNMHMKLQENYIELLKSHNNQKDIQERLKDGIISLNNKSFFGSLNIFEKSHIEKIVELKIKKPNITVKESVQQLKVKGIKVSTRVVESVFIIYFSEYPQNIKK